MIEYTPEAVARCEDIPDSRRAQREARRMVQGPLLPPLPAPAMQKGRRQVRDYIEARKGAGKEAGADREAMSEVALKLARLCARRNLLPADCAWMRGVTRPS